MTASPDLDDLDRLLFDRSPVGYVATDAHGTVLRANRALLAMVGRDRDEVLRRPLVELLTRSSRLFYETRYAPALALRGGAREVALELAQADGGSRPVLVNADVLTTPDGRRYVVAALFEATQRRAYEQELVRAKEQAQAAETHATSLARTLQQTLIPPVPPQIPGLEIAAAYRPAGSGEEVGGDFYDVFQVGDAWVVALGDVRGKGVGAAVVTSLLRHAIRAASAARLGPEEVLRTVNEVLLRDTDTDRFCTAVLARVVVGDEVTTVTVCAAGHPLPALVSPDGHCDFVGLPGTLLGVLEDVDVHATDIVLGAGDQLVLFTDGITEGRRGDVFYGEDGLRASVRRRHATADDLVTGLLDDVLAFQGGDARDDIAVVGLRRLPRSP